MKICFSKQSADFRSLQGTFFDRNSPLFVVNVVVVNDFIYIYQIHFKLDIKHTWKKEIRVCLHERPCPFTKEEIRATQQKKYFMNLNFSPPDYWDQTKLNRTSNILAIRWKDTKGLSVFSKCFAIIQISLWETTAESGRRALTPPGEYSLFVCLCMHSDLSLIYIS